MAKREALKGASGAERIAAAASIIHRLEVNALTAFALGAAISLISVFAYSRSARTESWPRKIQREAEDDQEQSEASLGGHAIEDGASRIRIERVSVKRAHIA